MAEAKRVQLLRIAAWLVSLTVGGFLLVGPFFPVVAFAAPVGNTPAAEIIKDSAVWPVIWWSCGWPLLFARRRDPGRVFGDVAAVLRVLWTLGCVLLLLHIAVAFHLGHAWSHPAAWEHTRRAGGYGDGVFVNYAFVLVWLADVVWAWAAFGSYLARPRWTRWAVFVFLAFVMFNATVVFGGRRTLFLVLLGCSSFCVWMVWRAVRQDDELNAERSEGERGA